MFNYLNPCGYLSPLRRIWVCSVAIAAFSALVPRVCAQPTPSTGPNCLTVVFWNIQWFPGRYPSPNAAAEKRQITAVHAEMAKLNPDIMGMEEVRNWDMAALAVQPLKGMKVDVCANFPPREGQNEAQEVAIASRLHPLSAWVEQWKPAGPIIPPRGFAFADFSKLLLTFLHFLLSIRD